MVSWHWTDYIILSIIGASVITGLFRGFVKELIALIVWILAIWLAYRYAAVVNQYLIPYISDNKIRMAISFAAILLGTIILGALVNALLSFILSRAGMSGTDRLLGMGFGFVRGIFIVSLIMLMIQIAGVTLEPYRAQSKLYAKFDPIVRWMHGYVPGFIGKVKQIEVENNKSSIDSEKEEQLALDDVSKMEEARST